MIIPFFKCSHNSRYQNLKGTLPGVSVARWVTAEKMESYCKVIVSISYENSKLKPSKEMHSLQFWLLFLCLPSAGILEISQLD